MTYFDEFSPAGSEPRKMTPRTRWRRTIILARLGEPTLTGLAMSEYGDHNGRQIRVSAERIAAGLVLDPGTVRRHRDFLVETDWFEIVTQGGVKGGSRRSEYGLTIPSALDLEELNREIKSLTSDLSARRIRASALPPSIYHAHRRAGLISRTDARGQTELTQPDHADTDPLTTRTEQLDHADREPGPRVPVRDYQGDHTDHVDQLGRRLNGEEMTETDSRIDGLVEILDATIGEVRWHDATKEDAAP